MIAKVEGIQSAIISFPPQEYARLQRCSTERYWQRWDRAIEQHATSHKLYFLLDEATREETVAQAARGSLRSEVGNPCISASDQRVRKASTTRSRWTTAWEAVRPSTP